MPVPPVLTEVRLPAFKSVRDAVLPLHDLTLLVGRNGSGKSNVLDGLWALAQMASGGPIRDVLDGGRDGPSIRGGVEGCAPMGEAEFRLGCTVAVEGADLHLDLTVGVDPVQITREVLSTTWVTARGRLQRRTLLETDAADPDSSDIVARWNNRARGPNPPVSCRASHLLISQVAARVPSSTQAGRDVHRAATAVLDALDDVFVLDPVPHAMRGYVPARDRRLRRHGENLSAVVAHLLHDPETYDRLLDVVRTMSETDISALGTVASQLDDVMLTHTESVGGRTSVVPARLMSDGTLRVLAILAALFEVPDRALDPPDPDDRAQTTLVIEEIENGLHPSQGAAMIARVREESAHRNVRTLATTHSPILLDALAGTEHDGVVICTRDDAGWTRLHRLVDLPNYFRVVAGGTLGEAAATDRLRPVEVPPLSAAALARVLGTG